MIEPTHMAAGQVVILDNGECLFIWGLQFGDRPSIKLGTGNQAKWWLSLDPFDPFIAWLPEYAAWRTTGSVLRPILNERALARARDREN